MLADRRIGYVYPALAERFSAYGRLRPGLRFVGATSLDGIGETMVALGFRVWL